MLLLGKVMHAISKLWQLTTPVARMQSKRNPHKRRCDMACTPNTAAASTSTLLLYEHVCSRTRGSQLLVGGPKTAARAPVAARRAGGPPLSALTASLMLTQLQGQQQQLMPRPPPAATCCLTG